jgi:hypothetical protein
LERDRIGAEYAQAVATGVAGVAQGIAGLGIGGGILLGAVFFKGEIDDALDALRNWLPNSDYDIGSPAWVASWGDDPTAVVFQDNETPNDEAAVDKLVNERGETLAGQTPWQAYQNGAIGREAEYTHRIQTDTLNMTPAQVANYMNYPSSQPPPIRCSADMYGYQIAIRETVARNLLAKRLATFGLSFLWDWNTEVSNVKEYISDPMLDWAACATYESCLAIISKTQRRRGAELISFFMNWQPSP